MAGKPTTQKPQRRTPGKSRLRLGVALVALLAVGSIAWLSLRDGDDSTSEPGTAEIVSVDSLLKTAASQRDPIYWAGPSSGTKLELSRPGGGRTYVRYLTGDADAGDPTAAFLTVGTYAQANPVAALRRQGRRTGGVLATAPGGAVVYFNRISPHSAYLAYPGDRVEVEVYDPDFTRVLRLVKSGRIVPVVGRPKVEAAP